MSMSIPNNSAASRTCSGLKGRLCETAPSERRVRRREMGRAGIGRKMQLEDMLEEDKMVLSKLLCKMSSEVVAGK